MTEFGKKTVRQRFRMVAIVLLITLLCGCAGDVKPEKRKAVPESERPSAMTPTPTPTEIPKPTATPTPAKAPDNYSVSDLYEKDPRFENVYRVNLSTMVENTTFDSAKTRDGYVLLKVVVANGSDDVYTTRYNRRLILFHIGMPEVISSYDLPVDVYDSGIELLSDGTSIICFDNLDGSGVDVQVLDTSLQEKKTFHANGWLLGCTEDDELLFLNSFEEKLSAYDANGEELWSHTIEGVNYIDKMYRDSNDKLRINVFINGRGYELLELDTVTGEMKKVDTGHVDPNCYEDYYVYDGEATWYFQPVAATNLLVSYPHKLPNEYISFFRDARYASTGYETTETDDGSVFRRDRLFLVTDIVKKVTYAPAFVDALYEDGATVNMHSFVDDDNILIYREDYSRKGVEVYLWNYAAGATSEIEGYSLVNERDKKNAVDEIVGKIKERFGITVCYLPIDLETTLFDYRMVPIEDEFALIDAMNLLYTTFAEFPEGFWQEIPGKSKDGLTFFVCYEFERLSNNMVETASAVTNITYPTLYVGIGMKFSGVQQTIMHETMHLMENRIEEYCDENDIWEPGYWISQLNTTEYPYHGSYTSSDGTDIVDYEGTYWDNPNDAWFIDPYSRTMYKEDRARVIENLYVGNRYYFKNSEHLRVKAEHLCGFLRAVFPSVAKCSEPVVWEQITGVVDPAPILEKIKEYSSDY
ncbi:MAG: hypothetical protein IKX54_05595 [Lachnospiraceae bacterium]|nr:hypothetical protein [Lachnospiraceae bacterium]